jgi:hypothetical protein
MILFFDGIGILLPDYLRGKPEREDPAIAIPLREEGLLHVLEPEQIVDKPATEKLSGAMTEIIKSGALDKLDKNGEFHAISYSRMGGYGEAQLAKELFVFGVARDPAGASSRTNSPPAPGRFCAWSARMKVLSWQESNVRKNGLSGLAAANGSYRLHRLDGRHLGRNAGRVWT